MAIECEKINLQAETSSGALHTHAQFCYLYPCLHVLTVENIEGVTRQSCSHLNLTLYPSHHKVSSARSRDSACSSSPLSDRFREKKTSHCSLFDMPNTYWTWNRVDP